MTVVDFPPTREAPKPGWSKPKTLEDWPWDQDLGKPHMDINAPVEANDLARYKDASPAATVCREAADLLDGDRAKQHGDKLSLHRTMANLFAAYLGVSIKPSEAAMLETLMKVARTKHGLLNEDDYRDGAAYMGISWECANVGC